jgi:hypothetical protein
MTVAERSRRSLLHLSPQTSPDVETKHVNLEAFFLTLNAFPFTHGETHATT